MQINCNYVIRLKPWEKTAFAKCLNEACSLRHCSGFPGDTKSVTGERKKENHAVVSFKEVLDLRIFVMYRLALRHHKCYRTHFV